MASSTPMRLFLICALALALAGWYWLVPGSQVSGATPVSTSASAPVVVTLPKVPVVIGSSTAAVLADLASLRAPGLTSASRAAVLSRLVAALPALEPTLAASVAAALGTQALDREQALAARSALALPLGGASRLALARRIAASGLDGSELGPLLTDRQVRVRAAAAEALATAARAGDKEAAQALAARQLAEPDPRVRARLDPARTEAPPPFPEDVRRRPVPLPVPQAREPSRIISAVWEAGNAGVPDAHTTVTVAADGSAVVETRSEQFGEQWHVRYPAWAWRDAAGNTVIDGRGQAVEYLGPGRRSGWIPDSLIIAPNGSTATIDDHRQRGAGTAAVPGSG